MGATAAMTSRFIRKNSLSVADCSADSQCLLLRSIAYLRLEA